MPGPDHRQLSHLAALDRKALAVGAAHHSCLPGTGSCHSFWTLLMSVEEYFPASYEQSRERFIAQLPNIQKRWPATRLQAHKLKDFPDLSIDWMWAEPPRRDRVLVLTTGEHGIEGFAGAAVMKLFVDEFA